jgi:hypothetical protein
MYALLRSDYFEFNALPPKSSRVPCHLIVAFFKVFFRYIFHNFYASFLYLYFSIRSLHKINYRPCWGIYEDENGILTYTDVYQKGKNRWQKEVVSKNGKVYKLIDEECICVNWS